MSQMSANMFKPLFSALPEEEQQAFMEWMNQKQAEKAKPVPKKRTTEEETLHAVADQIGDFFRPGKEEEAIAELMHS